MTACEIQISNPSVLEKIESFINDAAYSEVIENSANYNSRICLERRLRMPFLDSHTGVAQNHSDLFKTERQRMPGFAEGQVYTYPSKRWCKRRRQYLMHWMQPRRTQVDDGDSNTGDNPIVNEDSKDSVGLKEETVKDTWYYEDEMIEMDGFDEPDPDSDFDYEDSYRSRKKKARSKPSTRRGTRQAAVSSPKGSRQNARNRQGGGFVPASPVSVVASAPAPLAPTPSVSGAAPTPKAAPPAPAPIEPKKELKDDKPASPATKKDLKEEGPEMAPYKRMALPDDKARVAASPYCDFCLGDSAENKKTSTPEELVSCSDCGRSGHPSCLQFTQNMIVSVRKYRWQCIECKCCSVCGTSDNDDQLLFCDDCDRGYHMYCLAPPLMSPPEGSWSCGLCLIEFHRGSSSK